MRPEVETHATANGWIKTFTGQQVEPYNLDWRKVSIVDIAHALSRICRFAGHTAGFLSVAEHSVEVSYLVLRSELALTALLHDASEAYLGDMVRPLKRLPQMAPYREAEERAHAAIAKAFGTIYPHPAFVKDADDRRLRIEIEWMRDDARHGLLPDDAKALFLERYTALQQVAS